MAVLEGDPTKAGPFTMRFKLPAGYRIPPHWHPADEHLTILEGTLLIGMGDRWDRSAVTEVGVGGFVMLPRGHHHFAGTDGGTTLQLHGMGPWNTYYIDPANDPRGKDAPKPPAARP